MVKSSPLPKPAAARRFRKSITDGADFSGIGTVSLALKKLGQVAGIPTRTLFDSDKKKA